VGYDSASWDGEAKTETQKVGKASHTAGCGSSFILFVAIFWFVGSVANNTTTKVAMKAFPYPLTVAYLGLLVQTAAGYIQRIDFSSGKIAKSSQLPWVTVAIIAAGILVNFAFHRFALKNSSVPFTHTAKSSSTVFVALLSLAWLKEQLDTASWFCIMLLISGITLATCTDPTPFSAVGMAAGLASAAGQSLQVVGSKLLLREGHGKADVYFQGMLYACFIFLPFWLFFEVSKLQSFTVPEGSTMSETAAAVLSSSVCLYWQEASGFWFLTLVGPVSHSMGNGMRSLVVIAVGAWYFATPVGLLNGLGVLIAVFAVSLHGYLKSSKSTAKKSQ